MGSETHNEQPVDEVYLAGECAPPGLYKQLGKGRLIDLHREDFLPATLDGRVACYVRLEHTWGQIVRSASARGSE